MCPRVRLAAGKTSLLARPTRRPSAECLLARAGAAEPRSRSLMTRSSPDQRRRLSPATGSPNAGETRLSAVMVDNARHQPAQIGSDVHQIRDQYFQSTCTDSGSNVRGPRVVSIIRTVISVLMTSLVAEIGSFSYRSRASDPATAVTSGEVNRGSARRSAASTSSSSRASIRLNVCGVTSPAVGVFACSQRGGRGRGGRVSGVTSSRCGRPRGRRSEHPAACG